MTRIYLIRHAEAEGNLYRRVHGWYDSALTATGRDQLAALAGRFQSVHVDAVYASDLRRAKDTAAAIALPKGLEVREEPGLRELGLGIYEDMSVGELAFSHPEAQRRFAGCSPHWAPEGGETFKQVEERVSHAFFRIAAAHPGQTVVMVSHSTAIRCLQAALRGKHPSQVPELTFSDNTGVSCYEVQDNRFRILYENDASHLPRELSTLARRKRVGDHPVRFEPMDMDRDAKIYYTARQDTWLNIHASLHGFDGPGFLREAREQWDWDKRALQRAMLDERPVGILQLSTLEGVYDGVGHIPFLYIAAEFRRQGVGVQLLGQAVSTYRSMGRRWLRLKCAPENEGAMAFYLRYGFHKIGDVPGAQGELSLLEMEL